MLPSYQIIDDKNQCRPLLSKRGQGTGTQEGAGEGQGTKHLFQLGTGISPVPAAYLEAFWSLKGDITEADVSFSDIGIDADTPSTVILDDHRIPLGFDLIEEYVPELIGGLSGHN